MIWLILCIAVALIAIGYVFTRVHRWLSRPIVDHLDDFDLADHHAHWSLRGRARYGDTRRRHLIACDRYRWNRERQRDAREYWSKALNPFLAAIPPERKAN